jgi:hypothetical protein
MVNPNVANECDELYDREHDVYYVSFGTGEPSYCVEVDDVLVVEVGFFSNLPTGYRILNRSKIQPKRVSNEEIKKRLSEALRALPAPTMGDREAAVGRSLDKVLG